MVHLGGATPPSPTYLNGMPPPVKRCGLTALEPAPAEAEGTPLPSTGVEVPLGTRLDCPLAPELVPVPAPSANAVAL